MKRRLKPYLLSATTRFQLETRETVSYEDASHQNYRQIKNRRKQMRRARQSERKKARRLLKRLNKNPE